MYVHHGKQVPLHPVPVTHNTTLNLVPHYVGQHCVDLLREELGPTNADMHVPLVKGGVQLHKLQGVMHDTCNTANKTARLVKALRDTSGQLFYGYNNWELLVEDDKPWFDFLCGNHTRNLPMDAFNTVTPTISHTLFLATSLSLNQTLPLSHTLTSGVRGISAKETRRRYSISDGGVWAKDEGGGKWCLAVAVHVQTDT